MQWRAGPGCAATTSRRRRASESASASVCEAGGLEDGWSTATGWACGSTRSWCRFLAGCRTARCRARTSGPAAASRSAPVSGARRRRGAMQRTGAGEVEVEVVRQRALDVASRPRWTRRRRWLGGLGRWRAREGRAAEMSSVFVCAGRWRRFVRERRAEILRGGRTPRGRPQRSREGLSKESSFSTRLVTVSQTGAHRLFCTSLGSCSCARVYHRTSTSVTAKQSPSRKTGAQRLAKSGAR